MADPTYTLPEHFPRTFQTNFSHAIQQMDARLKDAGVQVADWRGKEHVFRNLDTNTWSINNTRFGSTNAREVEGSFRKAYKQKIEAEAIKFDQWDEEYLAQIVLPKSEVQQAMLYGYERALDDLWIAAAGADALGGPDPYITPITFPTDQIVPVNYVKPGAALGSNTGMTIWKLMEAKRRFENLNLNLDREEVLLAMSPDDELFIMLQAESAPNELWAKMVTSWYDQRAAGNKDAKLLGIFKVRTSTRLAVSSGVRTCYAFCRSGFVLSKDEVRIKMDVLPTEKHCLQIAGYGMKGIARRYDEKVIKLPCTVL